MGICTSKRQKSGAHQFRTLVHTPKPEKYRSRPADTPGSCFEVWCNDGANNNSHHADHHWNMAFFLQEQLLYHARLPPTAMFKTHSHQFRCRDGSCTQQAEACSTPTGQSCQDKTSTHRFATCTPLTISPKRLTTSPTSRQHDISLLPFMSILKLTLPKLTIWDHVNLHKQLSDCVLPGVYIAYGLFTYAQLCRRKVVASLRSSKCVCVHSSPCSLGHFTAPPPLPHNTASHCPVPQSVHSISCTF